MKTKTLFTGFLCLVLSTTIKAQDVITVAGDYHSSNQSSLSWTVGELITETTSNQQTILSQGFQQYDLMVTALPAFNLFMSDWSVYPNPTSRSLHIESPDLHNYANVNALIFDLQGKLLVREALGHQQNVIDLSRLSAGTYVLKLIDRDNNYLCSFYIIKQQ